VVEGGVPKAARCLAEVEILPGVIDALARLRNAGFRLIMVTNQPDVARGTLDRSDAEAINAHLQLALKLDRVLCCYHDDIDDCCCRKPRPGLLFAAAEELEIPLTHSFVVGDRWRDVGAGNAAGCTTILLRFPYSGERAQADFEVSNLNEAADVILENWGTRA
jgi:D-glycero-D-manno-heptose 1,7-bisphosphate phosphatase